MKALSTHERFSRVFAHKEADRVPIIDNPWHSTINRWLREGMPYDVDWRDFFEVDKVETIEVDISPRYECKTIEETKDYTIHTSPWRGYTERI